MPLLIKICGLSTPESVGVALAAGADLIGFVFHPKSPRYVSREQATKLAKPARGLAKVVALTVNPSDPTLSDIAGALTPDMVQLHGSEAPERVAEIAQQHGPVLKAIGVAQAEDLAPAAAYSSKATLLIDAKPPKDAAYPGGHGRPFDWTILKALDANLPFMLSGGLTPENVGEAIRTVRGYGLNLIGVDVSSGVESGPGVKDITKMRAFVAAARAAG